jgi:aspartyl-tRNA(Asn)/glutamyl-tRNA(Gln) amidotransferase subunit B
MGGEVTYEPVIGLEVHVQLKTATKAFSRSLCNGGGGPNQTTDPVVMGLPGALPVLNREAVRQTVRAGLLFHCHIARISSWDRKNYFYPDSPKNFQITQQAHPLCIGGEVEIELLGDARNIMGRHRMVQLNRIHLEEDVGKLIHGDNCSYVDFNRAGIPLAEIVSEPDLHTADEAVAYLNALRIYLSHAGVSDCDMEKGQMRCDVNVSLRPIGMDELGIRVELKNLNSISAVRNAIDYEISRQTALLRRGEAISRETRRWEMERGRSQAMRHKENLNDYCYFPDPDLPAVHLSEEEICELRESLPELPFDRQRRYMAEWQLPYTITSVLYPSRQLCEYFDAAVRRHNNPKAIANLIANDLLRLTENLDEVLQPSPENLADLVALVDGGKLSKQAAQDLLAIIHQTGEAPFVAANRLALLGNALDEGELKEICRGVIADNPKAVAEFRSGKNNAINALKGATMKKCRADPAAIDHILRQLLL